MTLDLEQSFRLDAELGKVGLTKHGVSGQAALLLDNNADLTREELTDLLLNGRHVTTLTLTDDSGTTGSLYQGPIESQIVETHAVRIDSKAGRTSLKTTLNWKIDDEDVKHRLIACSWQRAELTLKRLGEAGDKPDPAEASEDDTEQLTIADGIEIASLNGVNDVNADKLAALQITTMGDLYRSLHVGNRFDSYGLSEAAIKALRAKLADLGLEEPTPTETPANAA